MTEEIKLPSALDLYHRDRRPCKYFAGVEPFGDISYGVCQSQAPPLLIDLKEGKTVNLCEYNNRTCDNLPKPPQEAI